MEDPRSSPPRRSAFGSIPALLWGALGLTLALYGLGYVAIEVGRNLGLDRVDGQFGHELRIFHVLFLTHEPFGLATSLLVLALAFGALFVRRTRVGEDRGSAGAPRPWVWVWVLAIAAAALTWVGCRTVYHSYPLSMDEYGAEMQARILGSGQVRAPIPAQWRPYAPAMTPIFVSLTAEGEWISHYLPIYSLLRALTSKLHPGMLLNPLLVGLSVLLIAVLARRYFPESSSAPLVAALFLATSSQVLVTGMSFYTMPAHLAFNLLWLWLYAKDRPWSWAALAVVGFLTMGLHQYVMHGLFAAPFLLRLVIRRRWVLSASLATAYAAGLAAWTLWIREARNQKTVGEMATSFGVPDRDNLVDQAMSLSQIATWQAPAVVVLAFVAALALGRDAVRRRARPEMVDLLLGCIVTVALYFVVDNQGHGWGYRYFFPVLGNLFLLATFGWEIIGSKLGSGRRFAFVATSLVGAVLLQLPVRAIQVEAFVAPFADARQYLETRDADVVILDGGCCWYGWDLVRNDPLFETRPLTMSSRRLVPDQARRLAARYRVQRVVPAELERFGMVVVSPRPGDLIWRGGAPLGGFVQPAPGPPGAGSAPGEVDGPSEE